MRSSRVVVFWATALLAVVPLTGSQAPPARRSVAAPARSTRLPIRIERHIAGAPVVFGVPFPRGVLQSPDNVRVLARTGAELPSQISEVSTWAPADQSIKWVWVFFFAGQDAQYVLEFGPGVHRAEIQGPKLSVINNQRPGGYLMVDTGPMKFEVRKGAGGFLGKIQVDRDRNGFDEGDLVADGDGDRGSFVDLLDGEGIDASKAVVDRMLIERGSGPLHTIMRVDGHYAYSRKTHFAAPFVLRIHAYAGRTAVRVDHTFIYTGDPDRHVKQPGQHAHVATASGTIITEDPSDAGWTQPQDRLSAAGVSVVLKLRQPAGRTALRTGKWWEQAASRAIDLPPGAGLWSVLQTGPKPNRIPPVPESTTTARLEGFVATVTAGQDTVGSADRAAGWLELGGGASHVALGVPRFLEEYPKELRYDPANGRLTAFFWTPKVEPMSFARWSSDLDREEETISVENTAQGIAKTSEVAFDFAADGGVGAGIPMQAFMTPPVAHVDPSWYGASGVFGRFAARSAQFPDLQRAMDYKFDWMLFNQQWVPWYGMWDYGDWRLYFDGKKWTDWGNNEPSEDYICWLQFMRTGDPRVYDAARANSRHSMDVDNTHWPAEPRYIGDSNVALDYWDYEQARDHPGADGSPKPNPYVGIGSRHARQHWVKTLSAHVWVEGWLADYYLSADHRGLDVALQTADMHLRRIWGEHGLTGRRLYLASWNLAEVWDATKDDKYKKELDDYVGRMLRLQDHDQGGSLSMDRYGYADVYITHALAKYMELTGDARVRAALARHARRVRDVPALNHEFESYMSGVYALALGWDITGEPSLLAEMRRRIDLLRMEPLTRPIDGNWTQADLYQAIDKASHLPRDAVRNARSMPIWSATNGLRVFGWTTAYGLPFALERLERAQRKLTE